jgi:hypothetical protein
VLPATHLQVGDYDLGNLIVMGDKQVTVLPTTHHTHLQVVAYDLGNLMVMCGISR